MSVTLKNNIVKIRTYKSNGTGILYPCKYAEIEKGYSAYVVFTCAHMLEEELDSLPNDGEDIKKWVDLRIYDDLGNEVERADIKEIRYHIPQNPVDRMCDIAVFLVQIKNNIRITLEKKIYQEELKNREPLYVEGFPRVMMSDEINQKIQLEGMYKELFLKNSVVGMYQIKDEYHWYNDYHDLKLMEGFSGSPVYIEKNNEIYLLGMNQSVANIDKGENPFKIVYYLKMQYILDCLRQSNCIIFRNNRDGSMDLEWVLNQSQEGKEINILMLGGSGAGKSTFTKTFAYHSDRLKTTGDGQTTRSNIFYKFSLFPEKSGIQVNFFSKKEYVENMLNQLMIRKWLCFLEDIVGINGIKMDNTGCIFLKNIYPFFRCLKKMSIKTKEQKNNELFNKIKKDARNIEKKVSEVLIESSEMIQENFGEYMLELDKCYDLIIHFLWRYIPIQQWKEYFDISSYKSRLKQGDENVDWRTYLENLCEKIFNKEYIKCNNSNDIFFSDGFEKLSSSLLHIEGFFDKREVSFLEFEQTEEWKSLMGASSEERKKLIYTIKNENEEEKEKDKEKISVINRNLIKTCKYIYENIYNCFKNYLKKDQIELDLTEIRNTELEFLIEKCFQATEKGSLTSFVKNIIVEDKISDNYAWIIRRLNVKRVNILDSCGLDHVKNNMDDAIKIKNIIFEYRKTTKSNEKGEQFAVLYIKKLDAGKPDELRNILPTVVRAIPKAPIYCVFTGIDFLYEQRNFTLQDLNWSESNLNKIPKAVKYLLLDAEQYEKKERQNQIMNKAKSLFAGTNISDTRKRNLYLVLKNNLIPFCGNDELLVKNYDIYESNQKSVEKLLTSILIDEVGSMEIVSMDENELNGKDEYISKIVRLIFEKATITKWKKIHHMIRRADYNRLCNPNEPEYGYYSYIANVRLQWYQLFLDAYDDVISTEPVVQEFINSFPEKEKAAIEGALLQMGEHYIFGDPHIFNKKETTEEQTEFRKLLATLYDQNELLDLSVGGGKKKIEAVDKYLNRTTNFIERYDKSQKSSQFVKIFKESFMKQISDSNSLKAEGLIRINEEFEEALHNLEIIFETKYDDDKLLYTVLKEYSKRKKEIVSEIP